MFGYCFFFAFLIDSLFQIFNEHADLAIEHKEVLAQLKNMENILRENRFEASELRKERDDIKKQLLTLCEQHRQYQIRESISHAKIQDAIAMVETALAEKTAALQRERETRGEYYSVVDDFKCSILTISLLQSIDPFRGV